MNGILVCGLNGVGKTTLARALARATGVFFIDKEDVYFAREAAQADPGNPFSRPYAPGEVEQRLLRAIRERGDFVFASVRGDYGVTFRKMLRCAVAVDTPREERMRRIRERALEQFGERALPGGDLYEQEEAFFRVAESREDGYVLDWLQTLDCPILHVDGTRPVEENTVRIVAWLRGHCPARREDT